MLHGKFHEKRTTFALCHSTINNYSGMIWALCNLYVCIWLFYVTLAINNISMHAYKIK